MNEYENVRCDHCGRYVDEGNRHEEQDGLGNLLYWHKDCWQIACYEAYRQWEEALNYSEAQR